MKSFNCIIESYGKFKSFDIMPFLINAYNNKKVEERPKEEQELKDFIIKESRYLWWAKCEYEIILSNWPRKDIEEKWDVFKQIMMNLDIVIDVFKENIKE